MIVTVRHPGPVWHVPAGARIPRLGYAPLTARVRLREAAPAHMVPACKVDMGPGGILHAFEGGLWRRMRRSDATELGSDRTAAELAAYLAAEVPCPTDADRRLMIDLARGPIVGMRLLGHPSRGDAAVERSRRILHDGRGAAAARLPGFVDRSIVLVDGVPFLRCDPVVFGVAKGADGDPDQFLSLSPGHWRARTFIPPQSDRPAPEAEGYAFSPDRAGEAAAFMRAGDPDAARRPPRARDHRIPDHRIPPGMARDADIALMANVLPEFVVAEARDVLAVHGGRAVGSEEAARTVAERIEALMPAAIDGTVGGVGPDEAAAALERCLSLSSAIQALAGPLWSPTRLPMLDRYLRDHALPRLSAPGTDADVEAMGGLVP